MLNPRHKNFRKPTEDNDLKKQLLSRYFNKKIPVDSHINKTWLKDRFYMTSNQVTGLIKTTKKDMLKQENNLMGKVWIDWSSDDWSQQLEARLEEHRDKNTFTIG